MKIFTGKFSLTTAMFKMGRYNFSFPFLAGFPKLGNFVAAWLTGCFSLDNFHRKFAGFP